MTIDKKNLRELLMSHVNKKLTVNLVNKLQEQVLSLVNNKREVKHPPRTAFVSVPGLKGTKVVEVRGQPHNSPPPGVDVITHPRADDEE